MFLIDCCTQNAYSLSLLANPPDNLNFAKKNRLTDLAMHLTKLNASVRLSKVNHSIGGLHKPLVEKIAQLVNMRI